MRLLWACLCALCGLKPHQTEDCHVKANLEVTSSQFSLIRFKVSPLQTKTKTEKHNKRYDSIRSTAVIHPWETLPKDAMQTHTYTNSTGTKKHCIWLSGDSSLRLSTQKARRVAELSTCLILASPCRGQQSKTLLRYPTIPQCCFFLPGRPTAAVCHSLCTQRELCKTTKSSLRSAS